MMFSVIQAVELGAGPPYCRGLRCSAIELAQKAQIALEEQAQIIDAIAQHGETLEARAKCEPDITFRGEAEVAYNLRVHLPGTGYFQPAPLIGAGREHHVDFGRRFCKREEGRTETNGKVIRLEERTQKIRVYAF